MRRRFRRKFNGLWLPTYGNSAQGNDTDYVVGTAGSFPLSTNAGEIAFDAFPVTFDYTTSPWQVQANASGGLPPALRDIVEGNEWSLRRIVGKLHAGFSGLSAAEGGGQLVAPPAAEFAAGLMVCKTDEEGDALTDFAETNPLVQESAEDPWIWRRKWILSNAHLANTSGSPSWLGSFTAAVQQFWITNHIPAHTSGYHSVADGPHIDQKTARRIHRQERLYWILAARAWDPAGVFNTAWDNAGRIYYNIDNRFFGRLGNARGNRRNASR